MVGTPQRLYPQGVMAIVNSQGTVIGFSANINNRCYKASLSALEGYIVLSRALELLPKVGEGVDRSPHLQDSTSKERFPNYDLSQFFLRYKQQLLQYITTGSVDGFTPEEITVFRDAESFLQLLNLSDMQVGGDVLRTVNDAGFILGDLELSLSHNNNRVRVSCEIFVYGSQVYTSALWQILNPVPFHMTSESKQLGKKMSFLRLKISMDKLKKLVIMNHDQFFLPSEGVSVKTLLDGKIVYEDSFTLMPNMKIETRTELNTLHENYIRQDTPFYAHFRGFMQDTNTILDTLSHLDGKRGRIYRDISKSRLRKPQLIMIQPIGE